MKVGVYLIILRAQSSEKFYFRGELQGLARSWYEDGAPMTRGYYSNGMKDGLFTTYYESGKLFEEIKYEYGTPKFKKVYREDGTLADEQGFF
jgi:antitoxin component YwqK of YwqJK toxin-antitoxin module